MVHNPAFEPDQQGQPQQQQQQGDTYYMEQTATLTSAHLTYQSPREEDG